MTGDLNRSPSRSEPGPPERRPAPGSASMRPRSYLGCARRIDRNFRQDRRPPAVPSWGGQEGRMASKDELHAAWGAGGRWREIPESMDVYGWLLGSWELDVRRVGSDIVQVGRHADGTPIR